MGRKASSPKEAGAATRFVDWRLSMPPLAQKLIERPELEQRLAGLIGDHRLILVSATAGAGKTTTIQRALALRQEPVAWLTLDASDAAAGRLLTYIEAALAKVTAVVPGRSRSALASGVPHQDAAGLLVEAVGDAPVTLVLDEVEHVQQASVAWKLIEALSRYAPESLRLVLVSRRPIQLSNRVPIDQIAWVTEEDLSFSRDEVARVLDAADNTDASADSVFEASGGWVTGVLFDSVRTGEASPRLGGGADPLHGYLASQILDELAPAEREFIVRSSVLHEVSSERAERIGLSGAGAHLSALRGANLPVAWSSAGDVMRCHSRFREFLLSRLDESDRSLVTELRRKTGELLLSEGHLEEAVEEFLAAGAIDQAAETANRVFPDVIERMDLDVAERWLRLLGDSAQAYQVVEVELLLATGNDDYGRAVQIADELKRSGERDAIASKSSRAAALMAWSYGHAGRLDEVRQLQSVVPEGPDAGAIRFLLWMTDGGDADERVPDLDVELASGLLQALVMRGRVPLGRLDLSTEMPESQWVSALATPWMVGAMRASGRTTEAMELYESLRSHASTSIGLISAIAPELFLDAGQFNEARRLAQQGFVMAHKHGSSLLACYNRCAAAKIALRADRDWKTALEIIDKMGSEPAAHHANIEELTHVWRGWAFLECARNQEAFDELALAVEGMRNSSRILELPTAAVLLAEAAWRLGLEDRADEAADVALEAAKEQGSNHILFQAIGDFPAVLSRRLDAEAGADSPWHAIGQALSTMPQRAVLVPSSGILAHFKDLGEPQLMVAGEVVRPRIAKTLELLAYLLLRPECMASREELLDALFDGRSDNSTNSYLRQAITWLRRILPGDNAVMTTEGRVQLRTEHAITSDSLLAELALSEARRQRGAHRSAAFGRAEELLEKGEFLHGSASPWVSDRRQELARQMDAARADAALDAFEAGRLLEAQELLTQVLSRDPLQEAAWRLRMRIASAVGDEAGIVSAYGECETSLGQIGVEPSPATRALLTALRR